MLYECFWSTLAKNAMTPLWAAATLTQGRAVLKQRLTEQCKIDPATLPYDAAVLKYIAAWKEGGGRAVLVTASDQSIADKIANHVGVFDEAHGSGGTINLKGRRKAEFLETRFGSRGFAYIGDSWADLPVWEAAGKAITLTSSRKLRARVDALGHDSEHIKAHWPSATCYIRALRPHQWLKNLLVFLPVLTGHYFTADVVGAAGLAFLAFSLVASSVYVLNDLLDIPADREHARKRNRPFAAGSIPIAHGGPMAALLLLAGFVCSLPLGAPFVLVMGSYFVLTLAYSLDLKRRVIIDVCILAGLYTLRVFAGGVAADISISVWLLAFSIFLFFSLAAVKRQAELVDGIGIGREKASGRGYRVDDLPVVHSMALSSGCVSVLVLALYINSPEVGALYSSPFALFGACLVLLYWITRTIMVAHRGGMRDDPVVYAVTDRVSQLCVLLVIGFAIAGMLF
jgi:4-hydroxybenzoate polyprenyltransferase/phosphoserine phosphatase